MSRFNEYTNFMEQSMDYWYQELPYRVLQIIHGTDDVTNEQRKQWYKQSFNKKIADYEKRQANEQARDNLGV